MAELTPAQWALRPLKRYADFKGRAPRAEFWWFYLATLIVDRIFNFLDKQTGSGDGLSSIFTLIVLVPWIAVTIRRLHDTGRTGWWLLVVVLPFVLFIAVVVAAGFAERDLSGESPVIFFSALAIVGVGLVTMVVFMALPGMAGANRYGDDPYGPGNLEEIFA